MADNPTPEKKNKRSLHQKPKMLQHKQRNPSNWTNDGWPKEKIRVGCGNVPTVHQTGKLAQVVKEMDRYGMDIIGISEAR